MTNGDVLMANIHQTNIVYSNRWDFCDAIRNQWVWGVDGGRESWMNSSEMTLTFWLSASIAFGRFGRWFSLGISLNRHSVIEQNNSFVNNGWHMINMWRHISTQTHRRIHKSKSEKNNNIPSVADWMGSILFIHLIWWNEKERCQLWLTRIFF